MDPHYWWLATPCPLMRRSDLEEAMKIDLILTIKQTQLVFTHKGSEISRAISNKTIDEDSPPGLIGPLLQRLRRNVSKRMDVTQSQWDRTVGEMYARVARQAMKALGNSNERRSARG